jgi:hypothetical protein
MDEVAYDIVYGPILAHKQIDRHITNGEVRIIVPADPEKLRQLHLLKERKKRRRTKAGLAAENNTTWGKR